MFKGGSNLFLVGETLRLGLFLQLSIKTAEKIKPEDKCKYHSVIDGVTPKKMEEIMADLAPFTATRVFMNYESERSEEQKSTFDSFIDTLKYCSRTMDGTMAEIFSKDSQSPFARIDAS